MLPTFAPLFHRTCTIGLTKIISANEERPGGIWIHLHHAFDRLISKLLILFPLASLPMYGRKKKIRFKHIRCSCLSNVKLWVQHFIKPNETTNTIYCVFVFSERTATIGIDIIEFGIDNIACDKLVDLLFCIDICILHDKNIDQTTAQIITLWLVAKQTRQMAIRPSFFDEGCIIKLCNLGGQQGRMLLGLLIRWLKRQILQVWCKRLPEIARFLRLLCLL